MLIVLACNTKTFFSKVNSFLKIREFFIGKHICVSSSLNYWSIHRVTECMKLTGWNYVMIPLNAPHRELAHAL